VDPLAFLRDQHLVVVKVGTLKAEVRQLLQVRVLSRVLVQVELQRRALPENYVHFESIFVIKSCNWEVMVRATMLLEVVFLRLCYHLASPVAVMERNYLFLLRDEHIDE